MFLYPFRWSGSSLANLKTSGSNHQQQNSSGSQYIEEFRPAAHSNTKKLEIAAFHFKKHYWFLTNQPKGRSADLCQIWCHRWMKKCRYYRLIYERVEGIKAKEWSEKNMIDIINIASRTLSNRYVKEAVNLFLIEVFGRLPFPPNI